MKNYNGMSFEEFARGFNAYKQMKYITGLTQCSSENIKNDILHETEDVANPMVLAKALGKVRRFWKEYYTHYGMDNIFETDWRCALAEVYPE